MMSMMSPPENYKLSVFLVKLAKMINHEELTFMKSILKGRGGIPRGTLDRLETTTDLFDHLQLLGMVTLNNIVILQALLWNIGREDLYEEMVKFAEEIGDVVYTCDPQPTPENGYKFTKFHLKGELNRQRVEELRSLTSDWMCVPKQFVVVAGVQPSDSWIITLMVPDICAKVLPKLVRLHSRSLFSHDFDWFEMDGLVINLTGGADSALPDCDAVLVRENNRLRKMNQDLEEKTENLWNRVRRQDEVIGRLRYFHGLLVWSLCNLYMFKKAFVEGTSVGVRLKNGAVAKMDNLTSEFKKNMKQIRDQDYDIELIERLLDSFRRLVKLRQLEDMRLCLPLLELFLKMLQDNPGLVEQILKGQGATASRPDFKQGHTKVLRLEESIRIGVGIPSYIIRALKNISLKLSEEDKENIVQSAQSMLSFLPRQLALLKDARDHFLELFLVKHVVDIMLKSAEFNAHPERFILSLLEKANRRDLAEELSKAQDETRTLLPSKFPHEAFQLDESRWFSNPIRC